MEKRNQYETPCIEVIILQQASNFASSFGGEIGDGSGIITTNSFYENE